MSFKFYLHLSLLFHIKEYLSFKKKLEETGLIFVCRGSALIVFTFLKMSETHLLENFKWKSTTIVKFQVYTNSSLKNQLVRRNFWSIYFRVNVSYNLFCRKPLGGCFQCFMYLLFVSFRILQIELKEFDRLIINRTSC